MQPNDDFFGFDVSKYLEGDEDEDIPNESPPISAELRQKLEDIANQLDITIDDIANQLVNNTDPIQARVQEIKDQLPDDVIIALALAACLQSHSIQVALTRQCMADRRGFQLCQAKLESARTLVQEEKSGLIQ
uniref:DUF1409 domain-containing protein n=1 Tax=Leersia perrieri TaxID=77586 RepID=A0A0D9VWF6_9ORYZ